MNYVNPIEFVGGFLKRVRMIDTCFRITQKVVQGVYHGVTTVELDVRALRFTHEQD